MTIPSIQTLRAFEAAARHQSYTRAARELGLTHSAISHRIRELQDRQKKALFRRAGNRMLVTSHGLGLLDQVRGALNLLELAFVEPDPPTKRQRVAIDVLPAFAACWLGHRLQSMRAALPLLQLELRATTDLTDFVSGGLDAAIRFGPGEWPDVHSQRLSAEVLFPVCTPQYQTRFELHRPIDLLRCELLRHPRQPWAPWFKAAGLVQNEPAVGSIYADAALLLQAAAAGEGVALARGLLALEDLRAGRLVRLFRPMVPDRHAYFLVRPLRAFPNPALSDFQRWLSRALSTDARDSALQPFGRD